MIRRRKWLVACVAALALLGACGGGGDDGDDGASASGDTKAAVDDNGAGADADADASADDAADDSSDQADTGFSCPVTLADVEAAYAPVQFKDAENGESDCTFVREDGIGSVDVQVLTGEVDYETRIAPLGEVKAVDGVGKRAVYSENVTELVAEVDGGDVLEIAAVTMLGVGGDDATTGEEIAKRIKTATVALATKAAANV